jgi:hypothetical protein
LALLSVEGFLWLSERFHWFAFNQHKGWTVLIAVAALGAFLLAMALWFLAALLLRARFQYSLQSLLVLAVAVAGAFGWLGEEMKQAKQQKAAVERVMEARPSVWLHYDYEVRESGDESVPDLFIVDAAPPAPAWLRRLLGTDFFASVVYGTCSDDKEVSDASLKRFAPKDFPHLRYLNLNDTSVTDAGLHYLEGLTNLYVLYLDDTKLTGEGLAHLQGAAGLQRLSIDYSNVTDRALEHIGAFRQLRALDVQNTRVTDAGLKHVTGLTELRSLNLGNNLVTDAGLEHLKRLTKLEFLRLSGTRITDAGVEQLKEMTQLKGLYIEGTEITPAGVKKLQEALPGTRGQGGLTY